MPCPLLTVSQPGYWLIQIHILKDKQCRSRSVGFFTVGFWRSQLIWSYTVCKGKVYPGSAGPGLRETVINSRETILSKLSCSLLKRGLYGKNLLAPHPPPTTHTHTLGSKFFPFKVNTFSGGILWARKQTWRHRICLPWQKWWKIYHASRPLKILKKRCFLEEIKEIYCFHHLTLWKHVYLIILKILPPKNENFQIKNIFHVSAQNIDCGYSIEPPW